MTPYYEQDGITIYHGDCREILPTLEPGSIDLVLTDPPYSDAVHGKSLTRHFLPDTKQWPGAAGKRIGCIGFDALSDSLRDYICAESRRVCKRWMIAFSDAESSSEWRDSMQRADMDYVRTGVWIKLGAMPQITGDRPGCGHENVMVGHVPGSKKWNGGGHHAVWQYPIVLNRGGYSPRNHPTEKPLKLMAELVSLFSNPGEIILDPFMGSGTTLRAAKDLGRCAVGIEIEERYVEIAIKRLQQSVLPLEATA